MKEIENYLNSLRLGGKSNATVRVYEKDLNKFKAFFTLNSVEDLNKLTVSEYMDFYNSISRSEENPNGLNAASMNGLIRSISAFLGYLKSTNVIEDNSFYHTKFGGSRFVKVPRKKKIVLTHEESVKLIKAANDVQTKFMIALMLTTAIRRDEVGKIKLSDISGCFIKIRGKGDKERVTKLDETLCTMLNIYMSQRKYDGEYLFYATHGKKSGQITGTSVNNRVKECVAKSGIDPQRAKLITAHRLRGTVLTEVAREYGIYAAQKLAGHANIATTMLYLEDGDRVTEDVIDKRSGIFAEVLED